MVPFGCIPCGLLVTTRETTGVDTGSPIGAAPCGLDLRCFLECRQTAEQPGWLIVKEQLNGLRRLALVARSISQYKIRDTIAPTQRLGANVLDFRRHAFGVAVSAPPQLFLQQVFSRFGSRQRAALVFRTFDVGVIHRLHVETSS